jgi:hypothetical protein
MFYLEKTRRDLALRNFPNQRLNVYEHGQTRTQ